jgi:CheY-like chemotaxis protein
MPVHSVSIANILNGLFHSFSYKESSETIVRFTAPNAKVLVVDDINTNLKVAEGLLLPYKMQVDLRKSGSDAIAAMKKGQYDLVFMDHKMPGMDGIETVSRLRSMGNKDPYYKDVPIIALTANAISGTEDMFLGNGFNDFLSKPIDTIRLSTLLGKWIPKEKQLGVTIESGGTWEPEKQQPINIEIAGLDVKKGIMISGGTIASYLETLAIFYKDGLTRTEDINESLKAEDLPLYTIHVHALKSAFANVGAEALSEAAKALEEAGKNGNISFVRKHNPSLLKELRALLDTIKDTLQKENTQTRETAINIETLKPDLVNLKTAIIELDAGTINETIEKLRALTQGESVGNVIENISDDLLVAEYDNALVSINTLLGEGE